jgi:hypothetical protein
MPPEYETVVFRRNSLRATIKAGLPKPRIRFRIIVKNRAALLKAENLRPVERDAIHSSVVHAGCKAASRIADWVRVKRIGARPFSIIKDHPAAGMEN